MTAITGAGGKVQVAGVNVIGEAKNWTINLSRDIAKVTPFGNTWHKKKALLGDWTAKVTANFDYGDTLGQVALINALTGATSVTIAEFIDATHNYSGTAYIKGASWKAQPDAVLEVDFDLEGTGAPTYA